MKTLKNLLIPLFTLLLTTSLIANGPTKEANTEEALRKEISTKLNKIKLSDYNIKDNEVKIQFTINDKNELIVTWTDHVDLDDIIKSTLNYKILKTKDVKRNSLYSINLKLKV